MQEPPRPTQRESTEAMARNIGRELAEIEQAISRCRGDLVAEPKLTGTWLAHLLISSRELLHNLLIDTANGPERINAPGCQAGSSAGRARPRRLPRADSRG